MNDGDEFDLNSQLFKSIEESVKAKEGDKVNDFFKSIKSREISFLTSYQGRKSEGVFYTDEEISDFMVNESILLFINKLLTSRFHIDNFLNNINEINSLNSEMKDIVYNSLLKIKICDPACGAGVFLLSAATCLHDILKNLHSNLSDLELRKALIKNLYGFDINKKAIELCILKLFSWVSDNENHSYHLFSHLKSRITLKNSILTSFKERFDIIIGNPPYGNILSSKDKEILKSNGIFYKDIYCTFLLKALEWSNDIFCFLVPKSFLLRQIYIQFRNQLLFDTNIRKIYDLGPNYFKKATNEVLIIICDKNDGIEENLEVYDYPETKIITYKEQKIDNLRACFNQQCPMFFKSKKDYAYSLNHQCQYCGHETTKLNRIRIKPTLEKLQFLNKIEKIADLNYLNIKDFPKMIRGEEDKGLKEVKKLIKKNLDGNCIFVNAKDDFSNYYMQKTKSFNLDEIDPTLLKGDNYEYYKGPRLLIKHNKIIPEAVFTEETACFTSSIYSLLHDDIEELKYLCAVLNSKLINFYCTYGINNQKDTTINLNQYMIRHLPIIKPNVRVKKEIVERADKITLTLKENNGNHDSQTRKMLNEIEKYLNNLYSLTELEISLTNSN